MKCVYLKVTTPACQATAEQLIGAPYSFRDSVHLYNNLPSSAATQHNSPPNVKGLPVIDEAGYASLVKTTAGMTDYING